MDFLVDNFPTLGLDNDINNLSFKCKGRLEEPTRYLRVRLDKWRESPMPGNT